MTVVIIGRRCCVVIASGGLLLVTGVELGLVLGEPEPAPSRA